MEPKHDASKKKHLPFQGPPIFGWTIFNFWGTIVVEPMIFLSSKMKTFKIQAFKPHLKLPVSAFFWEI